MGFHSPEAAALNGYSPGARAQVLASSTAGEVAAVLVGTPDWGGYLDFSMFHLGREGWVEGLSQGGGSDRVSSSDYNEWLWELWDEDDDTGVLAVWGHVPDAVTGVVVSIDTVEWKVEVQPNGYWVLVTGIIDTSSDLHGRVKVRPAATRTEKGGPHRAER